MELSPRLKAIADLVPVGSTMADIGTDHGYLPLYLLKNRIVKFAIAADIGEGPLLSAKEHIASHVLQHKIETRLGNGLEVLNPGEVDIVTIAGMGGGTIVNILEGSPQVVEQLKMLVLQPMTDAQVLRKYLVKQGWEFFVEELIIDADRLYEIIAMIPGKELEFDELQYEIGPLLFQMKHPLLKLHLAKLIEDRERIISNLEKSSRPETLSKSQRLQGEVEHLKQILEEASRW